MSAWADTYTLADGTKIEGAPISINDDGIIFQTPDGTDLPRVTWDKITQESLRTLLKNTKSQREKDLIQPLIEELPQEKAARREFTVKPVEFPSRPAKHIGFGAIFSSPLGWVILMVLYAANLFAAYEVAIYRRQPVATVCGLAAIPFLGVFSPIAYISMPTQKPNIAQTTIEEQMSNPRFRETAPPTDATSPPPVDIPPSEDQTSLTGAGIVATPEPPPQANLPEPIIFKRGDFSFNRRFFETKLAGFFRLVPSEADKDMVVRISSARGEFTGRRIPRITQTELYLQTFHDNATADEMIPFIEVTEVQIRHKDLA